MGEGKAARWALTSPQARLSGLAETQGPSQTRSALMIYFGFTVRRPSSSSPSSPGLTFPEALHITLHSAAGPERVQARAGGLPSLSQWIKHAWLGTPWKLCADNESRAWKRPRATKNRPFPLSSEDSRNPSLW